MFCKLVVIIVFRAAMIESHLVILENALKPENKLTMENETGLITYHSIDHDLEDEFFRTVYIFDRTVHFRDQKLGTRSIKHCEIFQLQNESDAENIQNELLKTFTVKYVDFLTMVRLNDECANIIDDYVVRSYKYQKNPENYWRQGDIITDTKWCGFIDIASDYHDLGKNGKEDRCCRSYHMCPMFLNINETRFNVTNHDDDILYHCWCGEQMEDCLKKKNTYFAEQLIDIYRRKLKSKCFWTADPKFFESKVKLHKYN